MAGFNQESYTYHEVKSARWDMINDNLPSLSQGTGAYENKEAFSEHCCPEKIRQNSYY